MKLHWLLLERKIVGRIVEILVLKRVNACGQERTKKNHCNIKKEE